MTCTQHTSSILDSCLWWNVKIWFVNSNIGTLIEVSPEHAFWMQQPFLITSMFLVEVCELTLLWWRVDCYYDLIPNSIDKDWSLMELHRHKLNWVYLGTVVELIYVVGCKNVVRNIQESIPFLDRNVKTFWVRINLISRCSCQFPNCNTSVAKSRNIKSNHSYLKRCIIKDFTEPL